MKVVAYIIMIIGFIGCSGCTKLQDPVSTYSYEEQLALEKLEAEQLQLQDEVAFDSETEASLYLLEQTFLLQDALIVP